MRRKSDRRISTVEKSKINVKMEKKKSKHNKDKKRRESTRWEKMNTF